ncbi:MAG: DUF4372 domain-containing protein [Rhodoferax sp.]|nr:DUF4372 domain-containing protein [Rhodoferax sp.]MDD3937640.1 DUF4372 domain-containing protein [Rhodoferax sp.]
MTAYQFFTIAFAQLTYQESLRDIKLNLHSKAHSVRTN